MALRSDDEVLAGDVVTDRTPTAADGSFEVAVRRAGTGTRLDCRVGSGSP